MEKGTTFTTGELGLDSYCMVGNFHGVLIFIIFVVDLAVMKFPHPR